MEETGNIINELNEIKTARDNIKAALENEGETVTNDIRTYAETIPNVNKVKTVNNVQADKNKNVQLDASKINIDDTVTEKKTIKETITGINSNIETISNKVTTLENKSEYILANFIRNYNNYSDGDDMTSEGFTSDI